MQDPGKGIPDISNAQGLSYLVSYTLVSKLPLNDSRSESKRALSNTLGMYFSYILKLFCGVYSCISIYPSYKLLAQLSGSAMD